LKGGVGNGGSRLPGPEHTLGKDPMAEASVRSRVLAVMCVSVRCAAALCLQLVGGSSFAPAGEPPAISNQAAQAVCNARRHPAYQVLVAQTRLPPITVMNSKTLSIGGLRLDLAEPTQSAWRRRVLAQRLETPVEFSPFWFKSFPPTDGPPQRSWLISSELQCSTINIFRKNGRNTTLTPQESRSKWKR